MPAIERYEGVCIRVLKKYLREGELNNVDIVVVSEKHGVVHADERVPYTTPFQGKLNLSKKQLEDLKLSNLSKIRSILDKKRYTEIFVVCGKEFHMLIEGFEQLADAKIVFCKGRGLGPAPVGCWTSR